MAVILADRRDAPERAALRTSAMTLGLAELRQGVWMRPDNLDWSRQTGTATGDAYAVVDAQCAWMTVTPDGRRVGLGASALGPRQLGEGSHAADRRDETDSAVARPRRIRRDTQGVRDLGRGAALVPRRPAAAGGAAAGELARRRAARDVPRLRRGAADAAASVLHADARPPFRAWRTRTHPVSARASIGRCVRRAYRIT